MPATLFDRFPASPATHPIDAWLAKQDMTDWQYIPGYGLVGPDSTPLTRAWKELLDWNQFVNAVRGDLKRRCSQEEKGQPRRPR